MGKPFDAELKAAFLAAVKVHLAKGWSVNSAYQQAKAEFQQEGKPVPDQWTCRRWLAAGAGIANLSDGSDQSDGSDSAEDEAAGEAADDYTRKLEAMLRLYRRRTEADVDAFCDYLLPDLFPAEEE